MDGEGRYSWKWTPSGPVEVSASADGYESTLATAEAGEKETVVELKPAKILELHIVDAQTGKPVPNAKVEEGWVFNGEIRLRKRMEKPDAQGVLKHAP